jgi:hypothetical protein
MIHQFLWRESRPVSYAIQELSGEVRLKTTPGRIK